jgi:hypothetical protein
MPHEKVTQPNDLLSEIRAVRCLSEPPVANVLGSVPPDMNAEHPKNTQNTN